MTEEEEFFKEVDDILTSFILRGYVEVAGVNEDGELTYQITEEGRRVVEHEQMDHS